MEQEDLVRAVNKIHASAELRTKAISGLPAPRRNPAYAPLFKGAACLAAVAVIAVGVFAFPKILKPVVSVAPASQGSSTEGTGSKVNEANGLYQDSEIQNILVLGLDGQKGDTARSDSMMILSIDKRHSKLKVTSLLRDMYVRFEDPNMDNRLNAAYTLGGAPLAVKTVENNFGFRIDNYVTVDYGGFERMIDRIGGVTIDVTEPEAKLINQYSGEAASKRITAGSVLLTGKQALYYSRIRMLDSDFGRTERQRKVVISIVNKLKSSGTATALSVVQDIFPSVTTDMKKDALIGLVKDSFTFLKYPILQSRLPADNTYKCENVREMAVLVPDIKANKQAVMKFVYDVNVEFPEQPKNTSGSSVILESKPVK